MSTIKKFHWFWAWDDDKVEDWLREQSLAGLHMKHVSFSSVYTFEQGEPSDYVYRLDYFIDRKDISAYLQIFEDAGWEYLGEKGGWQYFRTESVDGEAPEIYSDNASKAKKYERLILFLVILLPLYLNFFNMANRSDSGYMQFFSVIMSGFMLLYIYAMFRLLRRYFRLKKGI